MEFYELIPIGRDNAISRQMLTRKAVLYGLIDKDSKDKDRCMRKLLEKTRMDFTVLNVSNQGGGYYRPTYDDLLDLRRYIQQEDNRAKAAFKNHTMAKKLYEDLIHERRAI